MLRNFELDMQNQKFFNVFNKWQIQNFLNSSSYDNLTQIKL